VRGDKLVKLEIPEDADFRGLFKANLLSALRSDWTVGQDRTAGRPAGHRPGRVPARRKGFRNALKPRNAWHWFGLEYEGLFARHHARNVRSKLYKYTLAGKDWKSERSRFAGARVGRNHRSQ